MKQTNNATTKVCSVVLAIIIVLTAFPTSVFASIGEPIDSGMGRENEFGNLSGAYEIGDPSGMTEPPDEDSADFEEEPPDEAESNVDAELINEADPEEYSGDDAFDKVNEDENTDISPDVPHARSGAVATATDGAALGMSGPVLDLPPDVEAEFLAFLEAVGEIIETPPMRTRAAPGATGRVSWQWGERIDFTTSVGHYVGNIPELTLNTSDPSQGPPFCARFGVDPNTSATYTASAGSNQQILKLLIAYDEGSASTVGTQLAIWSITNSAAFREHSEAQAALSAASGVSTDGFSYLEWDAGSGQPFFTLEGPQDTPGKLKIIKKSTSGRLLSGAEFSVSGPGVDESGLVTNSNGEILVDVPVSGGTYTVTETSPPDGYLPADPDSQTVTIDEDNPSGTVTFENEPDGEEPPPTEPEEPSNPDTHTEVTTEEETETVVRFTTEYEYSDAIGQVLIAKRDNEGASLDGAIFNIHVQFANGQTGGDSHWEVYNGSRLFAYTHPRDDHEPAVVTVTEVRPPDGYTGVTAPQTATIHPTYTRITKVLTHTITITTTTTTTSVIDIESGEVLAESSATATAETELNPPVVQEYTDFIEGDREISLTYVNTPKPSSLTIYKYEKGSFSTALPGARFRIRYADPDVSAQVWEVTTGSDGKIVLDLPYAGTLVCEELEAPGGYEIGEQSVFTITVAKGEDKRLDVSNDKHAQLIVYKKDAVSGQLLAGAVFRATLIDGGIVKTATSGPDGRALFTDLIPGDWRIEEQTPPPYFLPSTKVETVTIPDGSYKTLELTWENEPFSGLTIRKVSYQDGRGLKGAVFGLYRGSEAHPLDFLGEFVSDENGRIIIDKLESDQYYTIKELQPPVNHLLDEEDTRTILIKPDALENNITLVFRNKEKPKILIEKVDDKGNPVPNCTFKISRRDSAEYTTATTGPDGTVLVEGLYEDWYQVVEIRSADNVIIDDTPQDVQLEAGKTTKLQFVNYEKPSLSIQKIDAATGLGLDGAVFRVWQEGAEKYEEYTTTGGGFIRLDNLAEGVILVQEQVAPTGYHLDDEIHRVELLPGQNHEIIIQNNRLSKLTIRKIDEATGQGLDGAVIRVWREGVDEYHDYITSGGGYIHLIDQPEGFILLQEQKAPANYELSNEIHRLELKLGETHELVIKNQRIPKLTLRKIDELTLEGIEGVTFRLTKDGEFRDVTTGKNGIITVQLSPGWWTYEEKSVPNGWILDPTPGHVELIAGQDKEIVVKNRHKPSLQIIKLDSVTRQPMEDVRFEISIKNGAPLGTYKTNDNGEILLVDVEPDTYIIREIPFSGYLALDPEKEVIVEWGKTTTVEFQNQPKNPILIKKIDSVTGEPLEGALFSVRKVDGTFIGEYRTGRNGYATITGVEPGFYEIREVESSPGYILDETPKIVELKFDSVAEVEFTNRPLNGIEIYKIDSKTREPLEGAEFTVKKKDGELIGVYKTSVSGRIEVPDLQPGWYSVFETATSSPEYLLDGTVRDIELKWNDYVLLEFSNTKYSGLQVKKIDSVTKEPLQGVKFRVAKLSGDVVGDYVTGPGGYFTVEGLEPETFYTCYETATIPGYILDDSPQTFKIKKGESHILTFENAPLSGLQIRKTDAVTGLPMAGVEFKVTELDGRFIGNYTTPESGIIFIENLKPGHVVVQEIRGLPTHKPDTAPRNILIETGKLNVVEYRNQPYPVLELQKIDADTLQPLSGVRFKLLDRYQREIGIYTTSELGKITLTGMDEGKYYLQEVEAKAGYQLDSTVREVSLQWGKTTTVEIKNAPMATLRIKKIDAVTEKPIPGVTFLLRDAKNNIIGEYTTNSGGIIELPKTVASGKYKLQEIKTDAQHVLDDQVRDIELKSGETTEIVIKNEPIRGHIQIVKKAADYNDVTKDKKGVLLEGAVFEIFNKQNNEVVDRIETDGRGLATSKPLPLGVYGIREITAPKHYILNEDPFWAEIKVHDDLIKFEVLNEPAEISVTVQKIGNYEAMPGDVIRYDFKDIANTSSVELDGFYFHDQVPTDALRLVRIQTGTWNEKLTYKVMYKTNQRDYRVLEDKLHTEADNELDCRREALGLKNGEYITDIKFEFGTVQPGFHEITPPAIFFAVNGDLQNEYRFTNRADVGGKSEGEWTIAKDAWVTIVYARPKGPLPKTGV